MDLERARLDGAQRERPDHRRTEARSAQSRVLDKDGASCLRDRHHLEFSVFDKQECGILGRESSEPASGPAACRDISWLVACDRRLRPAHSLFHDRLEGLTLIIVSIAKWLQATSLAQTVSQSVWLFPAIETIHVIAIALVVGSIAVLDLRILGLSWKERSITAIAKDVLPWTWGSFLVAVIAGSLMFISAAAKYIVDLPFQLKMVLIVLAGVNMVVFHRLTYPDVAFWDKDAPPPFRAKLAAGLSLGLWIGVVVCGRMIGFTTEDQFGPSSANAPSRYLAKDVPGTSRDASRDSVHFAFENGLALLYRTAAGESAVQSEAGL
jgi:hypothetical protein